MGKVGWALVAVLAAGLVLGLVHGNAGGVRGEVGNLSTPWLAVALVPAWLTRSWVKGVVVGLVATVGALAVFYFGLTLEMRDHLGFSTSLPGAFDFVVRANERWLLAGAVSGPVMGALGGFLGARLRFVWAGIPIGGLMIAELPVVGYVQGADGDGALIAQALLGGVLLALSGVVARRRTAR